MCAAAAFSPQTNSLLQGVDEDAGEAAMRKCFNLAFEKEVGAA
jgi:hypothetical protein